MFIEIDLNKPVPIFNQIMDGVRLAVATGRIVPGDRIPSIRDLAVELRVNPNTVAKAYQELERSGLVSVKRGMGYFVSESDNGQVSQRERHALFTNLVDDLLALLDGQEGAAQLAPVGFALAVGHGDVGPAKGVGLCHGRWWPHGALRHHCPGVELACGGECGGWVTGACGWNGRNPQR